MNARRPSGFSWTTLAVGLVLVLPLLAFLLAGLFSNPNDLGNPLKGQDAPPFSLPRLDGEQQVSLADLQGSPLVINFWATWCRSCPLEHPFLVEGALRYRGQVKFIGVAYEDKRPLLRAWLRRHGGSAYPTLVDVGGKVAVAYGVYGVPETYFIDKAGVVRHKHVGPLDAATLQSGIQEIL